jgi:hypothetical protein
MIEVPLSRKAAEFYLRNEHPLTYGKATLPCRGCHDTGEGSSFEGGHLTCQLCHGLEKAIQRLIKGTEVPAASTRPVSRLFEVRFLLAVDKPASAIPDDAVCKQMTEVVETVMKNARGDVVKDSVTVTPFQEKG